MSIAEIEKTKSDLIHWIQELEDMNMLTMLEGIKDQEEKEDWDLLPEAHRRSIIRGVEQIEKGEGMSSEEFWLRLKNG